MFSGDSSRTRKVDDLSVSTRHSDSPSDTTGEDRDKHYTKFWRTVSDTPVQQASTSTSHEQPHAPGQEDTASYTDHRQKPQDSMITWMKQRIDAYKQFNWDDTTAFTVNSHN